MKRVLVLGVVVLAGAVATAAVELGAQGQGQGRGGRGGRGGGGFGAVMDIQKINDTLYWIPGAGGNTAVFITAKGVVLVDTKLGKQGSAILEQVKKVTDRPVTHIINTHTHGDHTGSNAEFPASVEIVTHENTAANMMKMKEFAEAATKHGLPDRTYKDTLTLFGGNEAIDLFFFGPAHTNGDTLVVFRNAGVMHAGDVFPNKGLPFIDRANGGSGVEYGETIGKAAKTIKNVKTVITGHNTMTTLTWQDFVDYGEFNRLYLQHARESLKAGKSAEQAAMDFKLPEKFKDYQVTGGRGGAAGNFGTLYEELKGASN